MKVQQKAESKIRNKISNRPRPESVKWGRESLAPNTEGYKRPVQFPEK